MNNIEYIPSLNGLNDLGFSASTLLTATEQSAYIASRKQGDEALGKTLSLLLLLGVILYFYVKHD